MLDTRKSGLIQSSPPSLSRNELYVSAAPVESKPAIRVGGASRLDRFSNSGDLAEVNSETVITVPRMVQQPIAGAFSVGDNVRLVAEAVGDNQSADAVLNGNFASADGWTLGDGWSIALGAASCDGTQVAVSVLGRGPALVSGVLYRVTFTVENYVAGNIVADLGGALGTPRAADGIFVEDIRSIATGFGLEGDADFVGDITKVTVVSIPEKQWQLDAADVVGEVAAILVLDNIQIADAGSYTCLFTNAAGITTSAAAIITVT